MVNQSVEKPKNINKTNLDLFISKENGDPLARQRLIEMNVRAVTSTAKKFYNAIDLPPEDIISIGILGLITAVDNYVIYLGDFSGFMFHCIENELNEYIRYMSTQKNKPKGELISLQDYYCKSKKIPYENIVYDEDVDTEEEAIRNLTREELEVLMDERLTPVEIQVLKLRFGFFYNDCYTLEEVGNIIGFSRQRIYQIEQEAIHKLRKHIKLKILAGGFKY